MIVTEEVILNNKKFIHNYSDERYYIQKVGTEEIYEEAYDLPEIGYEYIETDKKIDDEEREV